MVVICGRVLCPPFTPHGLHLLCHGKPAPTIQAIHESEYDLLLTVLEASRRRLGFLLCGYVLMPDHWPALIWPQYPLLIEQVLNDAKKIMTLRLHARRGTQGPLWQHQFWDRFVRHEKEFAARLEYMHLNPVKKGLVKRG